MKITVNRALKWWASLTPQETKSVMSKVFLPHVRSIDLSNLQIKMLYKAEPKFCCSNCGGGFSRNEMVFDTNNENDFCEDCAK